MARALVTLLLLAGLVGVPSAWCQAATLYAANGSAGNLSSLAILNQTTGALSSIVGPIGFAVTGLAVHPVTGVLYGSTSTGDAQNGSLITIDKTTGAGTLVGSFGLGGFTLPDLTFTSDGTLYGWGRVPNALHRVNLATGKATRVGTFNLGTNFPGLGLAATADGLILATRDVGPLFKVDPNTGIATAFTGTDYFRPNTGFGALAFGPDGLLYGLGLSGIGTATDFFFVRIDLPAGHITELGRTIDHADGLAFDPPVIPALVLPSAIPTLSEVTFAAMAVLLTAIAVYRIGRRRA